MILVIDIETRPEPGAATRAHTEALAMPATASGAHLLALAAWQDGGEQGPKPRKPTAKPETYEQRKRDHIKAATATAAHPVTARIWFVGLLQIPTGPKRGPAVWREYRLGGDQDFERMSEIMKLIDESHAVYAYNGRSFDYPALRLTALELGVKPAGAFRPGIKPWESKLHDPLHDLCGWRSKGYSLAAVCGRLGIDAPESHGVEEWMPIWLALDEIDSGGSELALHIVYAALEKCRQDVEALADLIVALGYPVPPLSRPAEARHIEALPLDYGLDLDGRDVL